MNKKIIKSAVLLVTICGPPKSDTFVILLRGIFSRFYETSQKRIRKRHRTRRNAVSIRQYSPTNTQLPLFEQVFSNEAIKPSRLKEHLTKIHTDIANKDLFDYQTDCHEKQSPNVGSIYNWRKIGAPAIKEVISTVLEPTQVQKSTSLSNDTVAQEQVCGILFTLQLDVTTTPKHCSVDDLRFNVPTSEDMAEEFLFSKCLKTDTKGHTLFNALHGYLQEKSNYKYPDMRGVTALLKEHSSKVLTVHCVLHSLNESLNTAVKAFNKIKAHALNDRRFRQLCQENDEIFQRLLHTDVCWLSRENYLVRFCSLIDSIAFLDHCDIMYLTDFFEKTNSHIKAPRKWCYSCPVQSSYPQSHLQAGSVQKISRSHLAFHTLGWSSMWTKYASLLLLAFPTTYLVEKGFSQVLHMQSKYRNRLDLAASAALWLKRTSLQPATKKLAEKCEALGSH
uniref:HAT C-terminal dimerisation domain-containing protein n=1 Tax=Xiphophorus maculatus TaxID=8083 RepID=A0A3B5QFI6_XIPMA